MEDKLAFAYALLRRYDRSVCEALGLDLDPTTGAARITTERAADPATTQAPHRRDGGGPAVVL